MKITSFSSSIVILLVSTLMGCKKDFDSEFSDYLVAHYKFTGNALDATKYHNNGEAHDVVPTTDKYGRENQAYYFDGERSYIYIPNSASLDIKESFTISAWIYPERVSTDEEGDISIVWRGDSQSATDPYVMYITSNSLAVRKDVGDGQTINQSLYPLDSTFLNKWVNVIGS